MEEWRWGLGRFFWRFLFLIVDGVKRASLSGFFLIYTIMPIFAFGMWKDLRKMFVSVVCVSQFFLPSFLSQIEGSSAYLQL